MNDRAEQNPTCAAIIVGGGASRRMGFDKLLTPLAGRPLLAHTLTAFEICNEITDIILVCSPAQEEDYEEICQPFPKVRAIRRGGERRQDSVWNGILALEHGQPFVAIHDAARPLVTPDLISRCLSTAREHGGASAAEPVTDTLQEVDDAMVCVKLVPRDRLWRVQTPQIFRTALLRAAYEEVRAAGIEVTDETSVFQHAGHRVILVESRGWNFKVTYPHDVRVAELILQLRAAESLT